MYIGRTRIVSYKTLVTTFSTTDWYITLFLCVSCSLEHQMALSSMLGEHIQQAQKCRTYGPTLTTQGALLSRMRAEQRTQHHPIHRQLGMCLWGNPNFLLLCPCLLMTTGTDNFWFGGYNEFQWTIALTNINLWMISINCTILFTDLRLQEFML